MEVPCLKTVPQTVHQNERRPRHRKWRRRGTRFGARFGAQKTGGRSFRARSRETKRLAASAYSGAGDRNRTGDPVITSDVLYQLSYTSPRWSPRASRVEHITRAMCSAGFAASCSTRNVVHRRPSTSFRAGSGTRASAASPFARTIPAGCHCTGSREGRRNGATPQNRTGDTVIFSHVLYQLS